MANKNVYYEVITGGTGWAIYHLPASKFKSEEEALTYIEENQGDPQYKVEESCDDSYVDSITLKYEIYKLTK